MSTKNVLSVFVAGAIMLPALITGIGDANAQKFMSRQAIVNGLQLSEEKKKKKKLLREKRRQHRIKARNGRSQHQQKLAKRRAPSAHGQHTLRAPNRRVASRRAPAAKLRNPGNQRFRAPGSNSRVVMKRAPSAHNDKKRFARPPQIAKFRAPGPVTTRRAPSSQGGTQFFRAPGRAPGVAASRAPSRPPQRFNNQFASVNDQNIQRGIRFEQQTSAYPDAASVDLEILFDYNSDRIKPESVRQLITLGEALQDAALSNTRIMIAGHTDAAGTNAYNNDLSYRRAQSVSNFLASYAGISIERLAIEGYGEELLKFPDAPHSGQNRRVEIINLGT